MGTSAIKLNSLDRPFGLTMLDSGGLVEFINKELNFNEYYGKYIDNSRLVEVFSWLEFNKVELEEKFLDTFPIVDVSKEFQFHLFGIWLGGQFVADKYSKSVLKDMPNLKVALFSQETVSNRIFMLDYHYDVDLHAVVVPAFAAYNTIQDLSLEESFIQGFNFGVHEYTHALYRIENGRNAETLTEIATSYIQSKHSFPIKIESVNRSKLFHLGTRHFPNIIKEFESGNIDKEVFSEYFTEYFSFIVSPWIVAFYGDKFDIMNFKYPKDEKYIDEVHGDEIYLIGGSNFLFGIPRMYKRVVNKMYGYTHEDFCKSAGIKDPVLINKFKNVFNLLSASAWDTEYEFFKTFIEIMNMIFGKPHEIDLPEGFVSITPKESDLLLLFKDSIPTKVT